MTPRLKVVQWLLFSVVVALVPILFGLTVLIFKGEDANLPAVVGRGELLILVSALCAAALGDLILSNGATIWAKLLCGGMNVFVLLMSALMFAAVSGASVSASDINPIAVTNVSLWVFLFSLLVCGSSVAASAR